MAFSLSSERPIVAATASNPLLGLAHWLKTARAARHKRQALTQLLEMDAVQLDDIGLCHQDILVAMQAPGRAAHALSTARAMRARKWFKSA